MSGRSLVGLALDAIRNRAPVAYVPRSGGLPFLSANGSRTGLLAQYGSVGTLFAIVSSSASAVSLVDWDLYSTRMRRSATADKNDTVPIESHLAKDVLNRPNKFMTRQSLFETTQQHVELVGEGYWIMLIQPETGWPIELWPVRPDRMYPIPHPTDFLAGWIYCGPSGEKVPLAVDEVIQFKMPDPLDIYRGKGVVQSILYDLDSSRYAAEYNRNFFLNSAEPGGIIEVPDTLDDDEFNTMRERWAEQHKGVAQAHRVAILEKAVWKDRAFSMRDMQFQQLREVSQETIRDAFHFPKSMTGAVEDINRANAEAGEYIYSKWYLHERLERFKTKLNTEFLPKFGATARQLSFDHELIIPPDKEAINAERESKTSAYKTLVDANVEPDDAAEVVGLPPMRTKEPAPMPVPEPEPEAVPA